MAGFTTYADMVNALASGQYFETHFTKVTSITPTASMPITTARLNGNPNAITDGAAGSGTPGSGGTALTSAANTIIFPDTSPKLKFLTGISVGQNTSTGWILYDRLVHVSGIALNSTGAKNVGSAALPRYTDGIGVQAWLEITTANTTTAPVVHLLTYTDQDGNTGSIGDQITGVAAMSANTIWGPLPLGAGDLGIKSVETLNVDTAGTAGVVQLVLLKILAYVPCMQGATGLAYVDKDFVLQYADMPRIYDGASLCFMAMSAGSAVTNSVGVVKVVYG